MADMKKKAVSAAGDLSLSDSAALLAQCRCLVSADTGPLHLATSVQTPVVGLFGSTDPRRTGPIGRGHQVIMQGPRLYSLRRKNIVPSAPVHAWQTSRWMRFSRLSDGCWEKALKEHDIHRVNCGSVRDTR